jgi:transposase
MKNFLSQHEREQLKAQHRKERDKRICYRINAILLYDAGWTYQEIANALLLSDEAIRIHIHEYEESRKLKPENGGSVSKLNAQQAEELLRHLQEHTYLFVKDIVAYVKTTFNVAFTIPGMRGWLHQHGFSYKKPAVVPGKANLEAQEQWIKEYNELKARLSAHETICFIDGVHPTHNTRPAYGWIKKGERKEIATNSGRQRLNISGAVDIITKKVLVQQDVALNAHSTIAFFQKIAEAYPEAQIIHVFCDNARYFKNKDVTEHLSQSKIKLHFLPPYSPNLNPIERLWKLTNQEILYNKYYENFTEFKEAVLGFLEKLADPPIELAQKLVKRITDSFSAIGKASSQGKTYATI